jgi:hypothetical protein
MKLSEPGFTGLKGLTGLRQSRPGIRKYFNTNNNHRCVERRKTREGSALNLKLLYF